MSAFGVVKLLTDSLIKGLSDAFQAEPLTSAYASHIFRESPAEAGAGASQKKGLSFWPFRITRDEFVANEPFVALGPSLLGVPPLLVDVWYLATPTTGSGDSDQLVMEKTLQYFYDLGAVALDGVDARVTFETPGSDELYRLWGALEIAYALSCVFCARHVAIDSLRPPERADRVVERYDHYQRAGV
jgi:hypothetical protein